MALHLASAFLLIIISSVSPLTNYFLNLTIGFIGAFVFSAVWAWILTSFYGPSLNYFFHLSIYLLILVLALSFIYAFRKKK